MSDLCQFCYFVVFVEYGYYVCVVEVVNFSQLVLFCSIQVLEGQLGCILVECGSCGVVFMVYGWLVLEYVWCLLVGYCVLYNVVS